MAEDGESILLIRHLLGFSVKKADEEHEEIRFLLAYGLPVIIGFSRGKWRRREWREGGVGSNLSC